MNHTTEDNRNASADAIVRSGVETAMASATFPVWNIYAAAILGVQTRMTFQLCELYDTEFQTETARRLIRALLEHIAPELAAKDDTTPSKPPPDTGNASEIKILAGAATHSVGHVFADHLAQGGTVLNLDPTAEKAALEALFDTGKTVAEGLATD
ncbi:DUF697 domain-containing protein [Chachezhania antarctica]|uniref:DUF697 domain-containing protein n=1 Tax=Chachezhania antarctica TaxID=2340860 RepID=UPI000EB1230A|nr:DUF697 domain-containing protein [Chachezhania antarctica]|tara:strand:- start:3633 stop:4097 length:465 start_codon:yes stop_codon:yes gene_type:complete